MSQTQNSQLTQPIQVCEGRGRGGGGGGGGNGKRAGRMRGRESKRIGEGREGARGRRLYSRRETEKGCVRERQKSKKFDSGKKKLIAKMRGRENTCAMMLLKDVALESIYFLQDF